jgi:glycosyltransferase involved in cell wall biosynthesis
LLELDNKNEYFLLYKGSKIIQNFRDYHNVTEISIPAKSKIVWDQIATPKLAKKLGVDIIMHTKLTIPLFTRKKTVMLLHGSERFHFKRFHPLSDRIYFRTIYPQYLKRATAILSDCENAKKDIVKKVGVEPKKIKTVHLAGDPAFRVIQDSRLLEKVKTKYSLPDQFIIYVGHIYPGKNVGRLFKALKMVRQRFNIKLVMAGNKRWKFEKDLDLIQELGLEKHIQSIGYVPLEDLVSLYNLADMTVFPSYYECFPAIPLDANASGCPVVTSNTGGTPEAAGDAALFVNPLNVEEIADAIIKILDSEQARQELVEKGFRNSKRFSWKKTAAKTLAVLENL